MDNERYAVRKNYDETYFVRPRKSLKDLGVGTFLWLVKVCKRQDQITFSNWM